MKLNNFILLVFGLMLVSCAVTPKTGYDYSAFEAAKPKSILIIPPLNESVEVNAPYIFLSTISKIVAEKGYYVFPVAVIDNYFKQNGLPTSAEMNAVKIEKLIEHLNPDAVMYVTINQWGQKYEVVRSRAVVKTDIKLVESKTGNTIWQGDTHATQTSGGGDSLLEIILNAMLGQMINNGDSNTRMLSYQANNSSINNGYSGLPNGPYIPVVIEATP
ncbi:MAG: DUF799 family lipoprotein [Saccharospirillaceae bacterium]|nr:DUF799 domain-containing protein [Pseudomonadales bacterium]NRB78341.1 DUF799 family lipoprotein [Saccharospirillaceae bacterium]